MHSTDNRFIRFLQWLGYLTVFATTVSLYDRLWLFEILTHFTIQYLLILVLLTSVFLYRRNRIFILFLLFLALNIYKYYDLESVQVIRTSQASQSIKIASINLDMSNTQYAKVLKFIHDYNADILLLTELTPAWLAQLNMLQAKYPHFYHIPEKGGFGIAMYSRFPMLNSQTVVLDNLISPAPSILSEIDVNGKKITVHGVHLFAPMTNRYFHARNRQLEKLAELTNNTESPLIIFGDMNITSWSSFYKNFIKETSLQQSTTGQGLQPTWPSYLFPFYIQLDHILLSKEFAVVSSSSKSYIGSDHYPLVAEISLPDT